MRKKPDSKLADAKSKVTQAMTPPDKPADEPKDEKALIRKWQDRISTAVKFRDRIADEQGWNRFIKEYKGQYDVVVSGVEVPPINEVFAYVQTAAAFLNYRNPYIAINPRKTGSIKGSKILETSINYEWRELNMKRELGLQLIDGLLVGHSWNKDGISTESTGEGDSFIVTRADIYSGRVSWKDMVFNIGSINAPEDCIWMAQRIIKPLSLIKRTYPAAAQMKGGPHPNLKEAEFKDTIFKDDIEFGVMWEIWDKESHSILLIGDGYDRLIKPVQPWPDYIKDFPHKMLAFDRIPDESYPMSQIKPWEPQILESIKLMTMSLNHVKRWNRQLLVKTGTILEEELDKFEKGQDGAMIMVTANPAECAMPLAYAPLPPDIYSLMDRLDAIKRGINGQPELQRGGETSTQTRTLGELRLISGGAQGRNDKKIDAFEVHMESIARNIVGHMQEHFDIPRYVQITGETPQDVIAAFGDNYDPQTQTLSYTKDDIQGEYDIDIKAGSSLPMDKSTRMSILTNVLQTAAQLASAPSIPPFIGVVVQELLRDYDIKALEQAFDAQVQQQVASEGQKAQAAQVDQAKTEAETAKREAQAKQIQVQTMIQGGGAVQRLLSNAPADAQPKDLLAGVRGGGPPSMDGGQS